jgi:DNA-binding winged helix-turn-helix (wHTH) protein
VPDLQNPPPPVAACGVVRFGLFELDLDAGELRREGRRVKLAPQPYALLCLLVSRAGCLVTREEITRALWKGETFVDFDQSVNFVVKQVRQALGDDADRPLYVETMPKRGYRFIAPVERRGGPVSAPSSGTDTTRLHKALWVNIVELRLAEIRRRRLRLLLGAAAGAGAVVWLLMRWIG